jgi:hypothetical protein
MRFARKSAINFSPTNFLAVSELQFCDALFVQMTRYLMPIASIRRSTSSRNAS